MKDTEFNRFVRRNELNDLHHYLAKVARNKQSRTPIEIELHNHMGIELHERINHFAFPYLTQIDHPSFKYLKEIEAFNLYCISKGRYELTLVYPKARLSYAKKAFNHLANNKCQLKGLSGRQRYFHDLHEPAFFYNIECSCVSGELVNGGLYNLTLLVFILLKLGK